MDAKHLDFELENLIGDAGIKVRGLGVIVYKDGAEIYSKFLGRRNIDKNLSKPVTRDTRFRAASISKMFTIFTVMQLFEEGKINLDDDAGKYLNFPLRNPNCPQKKITVKMLACHTSSIRDGKIYSIPPENGIEEIFSPAGKFWEGGAHFAPAEEKIGEHFHYCNLNYGILGTIIENVTGERFDVYQRKNILRQLETKADYLPGNLERAEFEMLGAVTDIHGVVDDHKNVQPARDTIALENPYDRNFQPRYSLKNYRVGTNATIFSPQGGLRISFEEMTHALEMLMNGGVYRGKKILSEKSVDTILTPHWVYNPENKNGDTYGGAILSYGLGIYFIDGGSSNRVCKNFEINLVGHTGEAFGMLSGIFFVPKTKIGFIYMMNGTAIDLDEDPRAKGEFSSNYIFEEKIMNPICNLIRD